MKLTEFFRLRMPDGTDPVNIEDFNDNFEVIDKELKKRISSGESASDVTVEFEAAESRQSLKSGEKLSVLMGKAHRFFTDLKTVAFSGKYGDLSERPTLGGAAGYKVADNDTTNNSEFLATARVAYEHGQEIDALSRDLGAMNDNGAITGMDAREDGVYITYVPADGADPVSKKLGSNGITYLGDMPYTCTQDYGDCTLLTFCHQKTATQNVTIKNLNGSYNIKQIVPAHIGGVLCFLAIVDVTNLNKGATIDTESSDTKRVFII